MTFWFLSCLFWFCLVSICLVYTTLVLVFYFSQYEEGNYPLIGVRLVPYLSWTFTFWVWSWTNRKGSYCVWHVLCCDRVVLWSCCLVTVSSCDCLGIALPCRVVSCLVLSCLVVRCLVLSCLVSVLSCVVGCLDEQCYLTGNNLNYCVFRKRHLFV